MLVNAFNHTPKVSNKVVNLARKSVLVIKIGEIRGLYLPGVVLAGNTKFSGKSLRRVKVTAFHYETVNS